MKKNILVIVIVCLMVLVGCKTSEPVTVPEPIDIEPSMTILFDSRPDNSKINIITDVQTVEDVVLNSAQYLKAWELWENYAISLEEFIVKVDELLDT